MADTIEIKEVRWGLANRFSDVIEINEHLRKYPHLYKPIIKHELEHSDDIFSLKDLKHDISSSHSLDQFELLKFMCKHPKSFSQLLPFYYSRRRGLVVDINLSIIYGVVIVAISSMIFWGMSF